MPRRRFGVSVTQRVPNLCCRNPKRCHCYSGASLTLSSMNTSGTCRQPAAWRQEKLREELPVDKQQAQGLLDQRSSQDSVYPFLVYDCCRWKLSHSAFKSHFSHSARGELQHKLRVMAPLSTTSLFHLWHEWTILNETLFVQPMTAESTLKDGGTDQLHDFSNVDTTQQQTCSSAHSIMVLQLKIVLSHWSGLDLNWAIWGLLPLP